MHDGIVSTHQGNLTDINLRSLVLTFIKAMRDRTMLPGDLPEDFVPRSKEKLAQITQSISKEILEPVKDVLRSKANVVIVPSHPLQMFP